MAAGVHAAACSAAGSAAFPTAVLPTGVVKCTQALASFSHCHPFHILDGKADYREPFLGLHQSSLRNILNAVYVLCS